MSDMSAVIESLAWWRGDYECYLRNCAEVSGYREAHPAYDAIPLLNTMDWAAKRLRELAA